MTTEKQAIRRNPLSGHAFYVVHVIDDDAGERILGTYPFDMRLREFMLGVNESVLVRDETGTDVLVIARSEMAGNPR